MEPTTNGTNEDILDPLGRSKITIGIELFFCTLIILAAFFGNVLVIIAVNRNSHLRTTTNIFVQNLACTDICMAVAHMPFWFISIYHGKWIYSNEVCIYEAATMFIFGSASIATMAAIAINRYYKIVKPQKYNALFGSKKKALAFCALSWVLGLFFGTPPVYGWGVYQYHRQFIACSLIWVEHVSFVVMFLGGFVNGITITIFICYYKIYNVVKQSSRNVASHSNQNVTSMTDIKILKCLFAVVCGYVCCWMPVTIVCLTETIGGYPPRGVYAVSIYLMYSSSCINPIIYGILNPQFKRAFIAVFKCQDGDSIHSFSDPIQQGASSNRIGPPSVISTVNNKKPAPNVKSFFQENPSLDVSDVGTGQTNDML